MIRMVCLLLLAAGIAWNVRYAIADLAARKNQPGSTRQAVQMVPENPAFAAQLAEQIYATNPAEAQALLERAVRQNRYDAPHWVELALLLEEANHLPQAERALQQAAQVDATYLPAWSLANFYFRHGQRDQFWSWARTAARLDPDDPAPLFRLAWYTSPDAAEVQRKLSLGRNARGEQFVNFLMSQGNAEAVGQAAGQLLASDSALKTGVCEWLVAHRRVELALPLWNDLAAQGRVLAARQGQVTNGDFARSPISLGFDWRLPAVEGMSSFLDANPNALGFEFSGNQPDNFVLMSQTVTVEPGKRYALAVTYRTQGIAQESGLVWRIEDPRSGAALAQTTTAAAEQGGKAAACFTAPEDSSYVNLLLACQRQPGTVRGEGKLLLGSVRLNAGSCPGLENLHR